jgi:serpin B
MIDQLDPNTVMLLVNAIYFKGKWNSQFDINNTAQSTFYKPGSVTTQVPMMKQTSDYKIYNGENFTLAELPYGQGNFVMDVILPTANDGVENVLPLLTDSNLKSWLSQMATRETQLSFPRFKYGYKKELKDILTDMGMGVAFTDFADFSNISDFQTQISFVLHQALIITDEEGTEAAAATVTGITATAMPVEPNVLKVDHPFLYLIRETTTNSILFMGKVVDPSAE